MAARMPGPTNASSSSLLYKLDDRMPQRRAALIGLQHVMAMFVGIITPPLILARSLELDPPMSAYLISMALIASGLSTLVQVQAWGPVGSGLLSTQGTSFSFLSPLLQAGRLGGLPLMLGMSLATAPVEMLLSRFVSRLRRIFTPLVSGIVVLLIGLSLVPVAAQSIAAPLAPGAPAWAGLALAGGVIALVVALHILGRPWARMSAVAIALLAGYAICAAAGQLVLSAPIAERWLLLPLPFRFGLAFRWELAVPFLLIYILTAIETMGDLTATSQLSEEPIEGPLYWQRIRGGILADGVNSALAAVLNSFPNTTFSQNNGVIQLTGVASRQAGVWVALFLCLFGIIPSIGHGLAIMPAPLLGGLTLLLFGLVAAAGVRILQQARLDHRDMLIAALALSAGLGVQAAPELLEALPESARLIFQSPITTGGLLALLLNAALPRED